MNASHSFAGPARTTYQAKIIKPDGYPLESSSVNFKFTILDPAGSCILYSETYSAVNMSSTGGLISFSLGSGVKTYPASATTFEQVFSNITPVLSCDAGGPGTYSPAASDSRKIVMQFHDGSGWQTLPAMSINAVPYAMYANSAHNLDGKTASDFVQSAALANCAAGEALSYNGATFSCLTVPAAQTVSAAAVISALGYTPADGASVTTLTSTVTSANVNISAVSSTVASVSATVYSVSSTVTSLQNSVAASFAAITSSQWVTSGTTISYSAGNVGIGTSLPQTKLEVSGGLRISMESAACSAALAGTLRYNATAVEFCNGTTWAAFGVSGAGLQSLNGSTSGTQTLANGTAGTAPAFVTVNGVHTLNIPLASAGSVTAGLVSNADYSTFMGKITSSAASVAQVLGYTPASATALSSYVVRTNNLSDLTSSATARTNLGVGYIGTLASVDLGSADVSGTLAIARTPAYIGDVSKASASNTLILANSGVTAGTYTKVTVDAKGRVTSGSSLSSADVTAALGYTPGAAASGVTSLNGSTSQTQTFANGTTGTAPAFSSVNGVHTLNIPLASAGSVTGGLLSNADYSTFMGKITSSAASIAQVLGYTPANAASATQWITNAANIGYLAGNVGVGTTTPTSKLEVSGGAITVFAGAGALNLKASGVTDHTYMQFFARTASPSTRTGYFGYPSNGSNQFTVMNEASLGQVVLGTSGATRVLVNATGEVGLGLTAPTARLHIESGTTTLAPLKISSGALLTAAQAGAIEYDGFYYYITDGTSTRRAIATVASPGTYDNASVLSSAGNISLVPTGSVIVSNTTASSDSATGALIVKGGLGVAGNIFASGTIMTSSNIQGSEMTATSATITPYVYGSTAAAGVLRLESTTNASKGSVLLAAGGGKVGVGYTVPMSKLHIGGSISGAYRSWMDNGLIVGKSGDSDGGYFGIKDEGLNRQDTVIAWGDDSTDILRFIYTGSGGASDGTEVMRINPSGNVGIGTSAPSQRLVVGDDIGLITANNALVVGSSGTANSQFFIGNSTTNFGNIIWNGTAKSLTVRTASGALNTNQFTLAGDGRVGVNTSGPTSKFDVVGADGDGIVYRTGTRSIGIGQAAGESAVYWGTADPLTFISGGIEKMRITSGSFVGIGTAAPSSNLHLNTGLSTTHYTGLKLENAFKTWTIGNNVPNNYNNIFSIFDGTTSRLWIDDVGKIGIGTTNPASRLDVKTADLGVNMNDVTEIQRFRSDNGNTAMLDVRTIRTASGSTWFSAGTRIQKKIDSTWMGYLQFNGSGNNGGLSFGVGQTTVAPGNVSEAMRINSSGYVGIGIVSPTAQLHVASGPSMTAGYNRLLTLHSNHPTMVFKGISDTNHLGGIGYDAQSNSEGMRFWVAGTSDDLSGTGTLVMNLSASGNVGIGTIAPSEKLEVSGSVKAVSYLYTSDERLKKDIITLPDALTKVMQLRGVNFVWRNSHEKTVGFIAQEVEKVYPELVKTDKASGFKAVQYGNIVAILVEALKQEHEERVRSVANVSEKAESRINQLEKENQDLKARLEKIEKFLSEKVK